MRDLFKFITKNSFFLLFLLFEGISLILIVQHNSFQKSSFINAARSLTGSLYQNIKGSRDYFQLRSINLSLLEENTRLKNEIAFLTEKDSFNVLSTYNGENNRYFYYTAKVINNSVSKQYNFITLDAGKNHGLSEDMAVVSEQGVVGIITGVSENFSTVLPVLNRNFRISSKIKRNNYFGVAEWDGLNRKYITLKEIPLHVDVIPGDTIVSSGHSAIFPEGIPIGLVNDVKEGTGNFYEIKIELITDFGNLYFVTVIKNLIQEEQLKLENQSGL